MQKNDLKQATLITRPADLKVLAGLLNVEPIIAVDTESNSLFAYRERVCLVQFSTGQADFLVDPLALKDLAPLGPVFANSEVEKVFHAAEYDILCLKRDFGFTFEHLFDTMAASRILGRELHGLGDILEMEFGVRVEKRFQRANWGQRPLPADLLDYARLDTHYLIALRERLAASLLQANLMPLALEDFARLALAEANHRASEKPLECWQVRGASELNPRNAAVLQKLCLYRESVARSLDRPVFKVINSNTLLVIAETAPTSLKALSLVSGMTHSQLQRHGNAILQAVQEGLAARPLHYSHPPRPKEIYLQRLDRLQRWRKEMGARMGVPSDVALPRDLMEALAEKGPSTEDELAVVLKSVPWRLERFGAAILKVLTGK